MSDKAMWFGTKEHMQWIKCPAIDSQNPKVGHFQSGMYLSGLSYVRRAWGSHKRFALTWNLTSRDTLRPIMDYAEGVFGTGEIYLCSPFSMNRNALPQWVATPHLAAEGAPSLIEGYTPSSVPTSPNSLGYPTSSASYTVDTGALAIDEMISFYLPIPPGYTAWIGVHGQFTGTAQISILPYTNGVPNAGAATASTPLGLTTERVVDAVSGDNYSGVSLVLHGSGTAVLIGLIVQILPSGVSPATGGFISGQGQGGLRFESLPGMTEYSAALDKVGLSANLVEVAPWI